MTIIYHEASPVHAGSCQHISSSPFLSCIYQALSCSGLAVSAMEGLWPHGHTIQFGAHAGWLPWSTQIMFAPVLCAGALVRVVLPPTQAAIH